MLNFRLIILFWAVLDMFKCLNAQKTHHFLSPSVWNAVFAPASLRSPPEYPFIQNVLKATHIHTDTQSALGFESLTRLSP